MVKSFQNFEFKARTSDLHSLEQKVRALRHRFVGEDKQVDTYFNVASGRLKLRKGNIENALIYYERANTADAKESRILLYEHKPNDSLSEILAKTLGIKVVVEKVRRIYFIENVKFHFDTLTSLGTFVEVEAIDLDRNTSIGELETQCRKYGDFLGIKETDLVSASYSDLILESNKEKYLRT